MEPRLRALCDLGVAEAREGAAGTSTTAGSRTCPPPACGGGWRRSAATRSPIRTTRRWSRRRRRACGRSSASCGCTAATRCRTWRTWTSAATTGSTRRPRSGPRPGPGTWPRGRPAVDASVAALDEVAPADRRRHPVRGPRARRRPGRGRPGRGRGAGGACPARRAPGVRRRHRRRRRRRARARPALGADGLTLLLSAGRGHRRRPGGRCRPGPRPSGTGCGRCSTRPAAGSPRAARWPSWSPELLRDHPDADGVLAEAQALTDEVIAWTTERRLVPYSDGTCLVAPAPESRQWAMAMMSWAAPGEPDTPSFYWVTPPRPEWPEQDRPRSGCRSSAGPRCRRSPCTRSPPATSRTGSRCGTRRPSRAGCSAATRSSRAGRTTWRRSRSRRASTPTTRAT